MTKEELRKNLVDTIVCQLGVDSKQVIDSANFINDLQADSIDLVELVMAFEEDYEIQISELDADKLDTVGKVFEYLCNRLNIK